MSIQVILPFLKWVILLNCWTFCILDIILLLDIWFAKFPLSLWFLHHSVDYVGFHSLMGWPQTHEPPCLIHRVWLDKVQFIYFHFCSPCLLDTFFFKGPLQNLCFSSLVMLFLALVWDFQPGSLHFFKTCHYGNIVFIQTQNIEKKENAEAWTRDHKGSRTGPGTHGWKDCVGPGFSTLKWVKFTLTYYIISVMHG